MFERYYQTLTRMGTGFTMLAMCGWFLWPRSSSPLMEREEAFFAFVVSVLVWILTEVKHSEEVVFRASTKNDIRLARELVCYSRFQFREMLKNHDYHLGINPRYLSEADGLLSDWELKIAFFQDRRLNPLFCDFCHDLNTFDRYFSGKSGYEKFGVNYKQSILTPDEAGLWDAPPQKKVFIDETNRLADRAWENFERLINKVRERVPEAFDETISTEWFRSSPQV